MYLTTCAFKDFTKDLNKRVLSRICQTNIDISAPPKCSNGLVYTECGRSCSEQCNTGVPQDSCATSTCYDGCYCPNGARWDGTQCVPADLCPCLRGAENKPYPSGAEYTLGCEQWFVHTYFMLNFNFNIIYGKYDALQTV